MTECEFLFAAFAKKHNAVIRKIREIPPWEWVGEFLELEPQVLRFLGTFAKRHPECTAFKTAHTLASALAVYRLSSRKPKTLSKQERTDCIATNRDLVDEYSNALLRAYREIFNFLFAANRNTSFDAVAEIIKTIRAEHERTRHEIIKRLLPKSKTRERGDEITQEQVARDFGVSRETVTFVRFHEEWLKHRPYKM